MPVQSEADISMKGELQRTAAEHGHTSIIQYLLDDGAPVNTQDVDGATALMIAQFGHSKTVHVLLNYGADVNI